VTEKSANVIRQAKLASHISSFVFSNYVDLRVKAAIKAEPLQKLYIQDKLRIIWISYDCSFRFYNCIYI